MKTYFPTVPGQGDDSRGKVRVLEVREAPSENAIPKTLLGLRPFLEHEESGAQPCGTFYVANHIEPPIWAVGAAVLLRRPP